ncbi:MAG TPA: ATP-binding cassette domain-containing protein, partial [Acidimicrobiales bacterium]
MLPAASLFVVDRLNEWFGTAYLRPDQVFAVTGIGPVPRETWTWQGVVVNSDQLVAFGAAVLTAIGLWLLLRHTRLGLRMQAVVDRRGLAGLRGVDADRTSAVAWMISTALAGLAGVLFAATFNTLNPPSFTTFVLVSGSAVVLARFRSIPVALAGGLGIGIVQNLVAGYADVARTITGFRTAVPFILLFALLFALGDDRSRRAGQAAEEAGAAPPPAASLHRRTVVWGAWTAVLLVYVFAVADGYWQSLVVRGLATGLVLLSFTIVTGLGGMVSLAQAAFVTVAGFSAGWALAHDLPFALAPLVGTAAATAVGVVVALPARRLGGLPLALATMALAFVGSQLVFQLDPVTNDARGWRITPPALGPVDLADRPTFVVVLLAMIGAATWAIGNLGRSASGRAIVALRSSEPGAVTVGVRAARTKVAVFALSAAMAGFGGVWLSAANGRVNTLDFPVEIGFFWLASAVVFGVRRPAGAVLAGLVASISPEVFGWFSDGSLLPQVMFGLAALNLAQNPDGILGIVAAKRHERERRRGAPAPVVAEAGPAPATLEAGAEPGAGPAALALRDVRGGYGDAEVLHGVSLEVRPGQVLALVGANGAGKTTLCGVVAGTCAARSGAVLVNGRDVTALPPHRRVGAGAFLIPEGRGIFPALSV